MCCVTLPNNPQPASTVRVQIRGPESDQVRPAGSRCQHGGVRPIVADRGRLVDSIVYGNLGIEILAEHGGMVLRTTLQAKPLATLARQRSSAPSAPVQLMGRDAEVAAAMQGVDAGEPIVRARLSANAPRAPPSPIGRSRCIAIPS